MPASTTWSCCAAGSTASVLGHRVMAASTVGTFLRSFTFGHVRQLDQADRRDPRQGVGGGAGPGDGPLTVDVDSTICEVHGYHKQGAGYGYTHRLGYHPLLATRADSGEVLHARLRKGAANTARGILRFVDELVARLPPRRRQRRADLPDGLGVLVGQAHQAAAPPPGALLDHGAPDQDRPRRRSRRIPEQAWIADRLPARRGRPGRRDPLPGRPADRAAGPQPGRPAAAVPDLALPRLRHRPRRHHDLAGRRPSPPRRRASWPSATSRRAPGWRICPPAGSPPTPPGCWPPPWPTTCCAGPPPSASAPRRADRRQDAAADPAGAARAAHPLGAPMRRCTCPPAGRGRTRSAWRWPGCAASRTRPDRTSTPRLGSSAHADCSGLPVTASEGSPSCSTTSSRLSPATSCGSAVTQLKRTHAAPGAASGNQSTHSRIGGSRLSGGRSL